MSHIKTKDRDQLSFLPNSIEEYVDEANPVRVIDAFVDTLDLKALGFSKAIPAETGRPGYNPSDLLKLYIYGYMNKIRSSRKLMTETRRNIEVFYLINELKPDFRTISDFRKDNPEAIKKVFREFVKLCDDAGLYHKELIAIDGTKLRAQNASDKAFNKDILLKKLERIDAHIDEYMKVAAHNDETGDEDDEEDRRKPTKEKVEKTLKQLHKRKEKYTGYLKELSETGKTQILETDPDAHRMHTRNGFHCCYNIQVATDTESHLLCDYEVTNKTNDMGQLTPLAKKSQKLLKLNNIEVVADKGYDTRKDVLNAVMNGIIPNVAMKYDKDERIYSLDYKNIKITDKTKSSTNHKDIEKCIKAGVLPKVFENSIVSLELQHQSGVGCFTRINEDYVICPMDKMLKKVKKRDGRKTIFKSRQACRNCDNRCTSSNNPKEVCFIDGAKYVPAVMYGNKEAIRKFPDHAVIHPNSKVLYLKRTKTKVLLRIKCDKEKLHERMCTVEHPFGSIKWHNDAGYLLCRGKPKVSAEIGLSFLAYNIKRAINMIGTTELIARLGE